MVFCTYCGQAFTRDEHLERHILTHSNIKPFKCVVCHMSFARRDLLKRHYNIHAENQDDIQAWNPKPSERTPIACVNCCKAKTKCDKQVPCSRCTKRKLDCTSRPNRRTTKHITRSAIPPANDEKDRDIKDDRPPVDANSTPGGQKLQQLLELPPSRNSETEAQRDGTQKVSDEPASRPFASPGVGLLSPPVESIVSSHTVDEFPDIANLSIPCNMVGLDGGRPPDDTHDQLMLDWSDLTLDLPLQPQPGLSSLESAAISWSHDELLIDVPSVMISAQMRQTLQNMNGFMPSLDNNILFTGAQSSVPRVASSSCINRPFPEDSWPTFRCMPTIPSQLYQRTATDNLNDLKHALQNFKGWDTLCMQWLQEDFAALGSDLLTVMPPNESTRDRLLVVTQKLLYKALTTDKLRSRSLSSQLYSREQTPESGYISNIVILPPTRLLTAFLRSYAACFEQYYPLTPCGELDVGDLMNRSDHSSSLLVLMIVAQGASGFTFTDSSNNKFAAGLAEVCRVSLFDEMEKDIIAIDHHMLHSAILFLVQAAWSGDRWQMDQAIDRRSMCFAAFRRLQFLDTPKITDSNMYEVEQANTDLLWHSWVEGETRSRLIYSWVVVDQELALFYDTVPLCTAVHFSAPMPDHESLWNAKSDAEWSSTFDCVPRAWHQRPESLRDLFRCFMDNETIALNDITPFQLRLLLHPLHSMVCQYNQIYGGSSIVSSSRKKHRDQQKPNVSSAQSRMAEIQLLLGRWSDLAERHLRAKNNTACPMVHANLIVFHLVSLNVVTEFLEVERSALETGKRSCLDTTIYEHCISDAEEATYHCGQICKLIRTMSRTVRPPWWAGAIYRVSLVLWALSFLQGGSSVLNDPNNLAKSPSGPFFAIDALPADHPQIVKYLTKREGVPCITKGNGSRLPLCQTRASLVLQYGIQIIDEGAPTNFSNGIRSKLERLASISEHFN